MFYFKVLLMTVLAILVTLCALGMIASMVSHSGSSFLTLLNAAGVGALSALLEQVSGIRSKS